MTFRIAHLYSYAMRPSQSALQTDTQSPGIEPVLLDDWHVVADLENLRRSKSLDTQLFGLDLRISGASEAEIVAVRSDTGAILHTQCHYGLVWACLGSPTQPIVDIPEARESDRHVLTGGSIAVSVSGLRMVENFLDMGHFPFVHSDYLGVEPHTEVAPYKTEVNAENEIWATDCTFYQPVASPNADGGFVVDYTYRVIRPYTVALYKSNPVHKERMDSIYLFVQPVDQEHSVAHPLLCYLKDELDEYTVRWYMQLIFSQDKPILENQLPKRLPLDPRAETPIRADASSITYRRWLRDQQVSYGAIPSSV